MFGHFPLLSKWSPDSSVHGLIVMSSPSLLTTQWYFQSFHYTRAATGLTRANKTVNLSWHLLRYSLQILSLVHDLSVLKLAQECQRQSMTEVQFIITTVLSLRQVYKTELCQSSSTKEHISARGSSRSTYLPGHQVLHDLRGGTTINPKHAWFTSLLCVTSFPPKENPIFPGAHKDFLALNRTLYEH